MGGCVGRIVLGLWCCGVGGDECRLCYEGSSGGAVRWSDGGDDFDDDCVMVIV